MTEPFASIRQIANWGLDFLYPPRCVMCDQIDTYWCSVCQSEFARTPLDSQVVTTVPALDAVITTGRYAYPLDRIIQSLKYENGHRYANALARRLAHRLSFVDWNIDAVAAVPLHIKRQRERGYNQSQLLVNTLCEITNLTDISGAVRRLEYTRPQVGLNAREREQNVSGAFVADRNIVSGLQVLLVDDVITTGATLIACATAIRDSGAYAVYGITASTAS